MSDYQPLNLTTLSNASADLLGPTGADTLGPQAYRGVPFHIGDADRQPGRPGALPAAVSPRR